MSLYADYIKERENGGIIETSWGFATYFITGPECYIRDIYVDKTQRLKGGASRLADDITKIALEKGCTYLLGSVSPKANRSTDSVKVLLAYGFKLAQATPELIYFKKDIKS